MRDLLAIHTMEHVYRDVVYFGEEESFLFIPTVDRRVLFSVNIRVQAGIDLTDGIEVFRSEDNDSEVFVRLPPAEILLVDADESTSTSCASAAVASGGSSTGSKSRR